MVWKCFRVALNSIASIACIIVVLVCSSVTSSTSMPRPTGAHERMYMNVCVRMIFWACVIVFMMLCVCTNQLLSKALTTCVNQSQCTDKCLNLQLDLVLYFSDSTTVLTTTERTVTASNIAKDKTSEMRLQQSLSLLLQ